MMFRTTFGSWGEALKQAGLKPQKSYPSSKCIENSVKAHRNKKGFNNKGGKRINNRGYVEIWKPDHPNASTKGYVLEHRLVMSEFLGRPLLSSEDVHHKDMDKTNNDISNLELLTRSQHAKYHETNAKNKHKRKQTFKCEYPNCNEMTSSKYKLCFSHYKLQWRRKKDGLIKEINDFSKISRKHSNETKQKLSDIAKRQPRKNGKFSNYTDNPDLLGE